MPLVRVLSSDDVRELLDSTELRQALEAALVAQSEGRADVPPRIAATAPRGLLAAMPGYLADGGDGVLATKLVTIYPDNLDTPSHQGLIAYFDARSGTPLAVLDAEVITEERTAATAAIAADLLARPDADTLTIIGAGAQGHAHLRAFAKLRAWSTLRLVSRTQTNAETLAEYAASLGFVADIDVAGIADVDDALADTSVVALCTHAGSAVFDPAVIGRNCHVSSVGSRAELPTELVSIDNVLVVDHLGAVSTPPPAGATEVQGANHAIELGSLVADPQRGHPRSGQLTVYKSTGHAVQDLAAAQLVYSKAVAGGIGTLVDL